MRAVREDLDDDEDVDDVDEDEETSKSADQVLLGWLAARAIPGVERVESAAYRRTALLSDGPGIVELRQDGAKPAGAGRGETRVRARCGARRDRVGLGADPLLRPLLLGRFLGPELLRRLRAGRWAVLLGQQVTVSAGRTLAARIAAEHGEPCRPEPRG